MSKVTEKLKEIRKSLFSLFSIIQVGPKKIAPEQMKKYRDYYQKAAKENPAEDK